MIPFGLKTLVLSATAVLLAWGHAVVAPVSSEGSLSREVERLRSSLGDPRECAAYEEAARGAMSLSERILPPLPDPAFLPRVKRAAGVTGLHFAVAEEVLPLLILLVFAGIASGLAVREACRDGSRFASPTQAWLGKHVAISSLVAAAVFAFTPLAFPYWIPWAAGLGAAFGMFTYVANLPIKL